MKKPHKHVKIIKAWAEGEQIQYKNEHNVWVDIPQPGFVEFVEYRIKPVPKKYRVALVKLDQTKPFTVILPKNYNLPPYYHFIKWATEEFEVEE